MITSLVFNIFRYLINMEIILNENNFNINNISIKDGRKTKKLLYDLKCIYLIGINFEIKDYIIIKQSNNYMFIDIEYSQLKDIFTSIDNHFNSKMENYHSFIKNNVIKIKKHDIKDYKNTDNLYISLNNLKKTPKVTILQLFTV
jgi:hypothetical protein